MNKESGLYVLGCMLISALAFTVFGLSIYGLILAFSASVLIGFAVLIIEPAALVFGIAKVFFGTNLAEKILQLFN